MALASGVVADIATAAERGKWMGFTYVGSVLGPAVGPLLGRILVEFLGVFWFLVILASAFTITFAIFFLRQVRSISCRYMSLTKTFRIPEPGW